MDEKFVKINQKVEARQYKLDIYRSVMSEIGNPIVFNICMLGALIGLKMAEDYSENSKNSIMTSQFF